VNRDSNILFPKGVSKISGGASKTKALSRWQFSI